ncbi:MAG TPA: sugar phosphate isomerase/epimerase family protein [Blastocatellia bacterium]|nr:sugar phosphate isomerase/epimerase family protein [Blastocatellia bacterium]
MRINRREFIQSGLTGLASAALLRQQGLAAYAAAKGVKFRVGVPDWNLRQTVKVEAVALAKKIGFDGVQVSIGMAPRGQQIDRLPLADRELQQKYLAESKRLGLPLTSLCLDILHQNGLKSDPLGQRWVAESIPIAKAMGVKVILLPFFGKWAIKQRAEQERVGEVLKEVAPLAEKAGIILGLENTISARENVQIMERARSQAVLVYYDVGNSTGEGYNIIEEIRWLGNRRICEVHLKDNPHYLGQGKIDFRAVIDALAEIGFDKWAQLECDAPSGSVENDMLTNLKFIRGLMAGRQAQG